MLKQIFQMVPEGKDCIQMKHENRFALRNQSISLILAIILFLSFILVIENITPISAYAKEKVLQIEGTVYSFDQKELYPFSTASENSKEKAFGTLTISGDIYKESENNKTPSISVKRKYDGKEKGLSITYAYNDSLLNASEEKWHLIDDKGKTVDLLALDEKILKGAIILQTSKDGKIWVTDYTETNAFASVPNRSDPFYTTTDIQMANGCYYRIIVSYEVQRKIDSKKVVFVDVEQNETKKIAEVYEFYVYDETAQISTNNDQTQKYNLGSKNRTEKYEGYFGSVSSITNKDPHYGWELGQFFISGYTDTRKDADNEIIFLKNVGDQVTLWFNLLQDINALNGEPEKTIIDSTKDYDQFFETPTIDFGHGALIVRKTNYENIQEKPIIYTNYLEASATVGANTKVNLFEEGDYEIALDYGINYDKTKVLGKTVLPEQAHYRIYFKFKVRNANSMFYPRDISTTSELYNNANTPNGFYLDLANSKYLQLYYTREILKDGATGLSEDVRVNALAKDGDAFKDEGIYTITVTNQYTGKFTTKKIYVGENNILKAYLATGLPISEIRDKIAMGATINEDGTIIEPVPVATAEAIITSEPVVTMAPNNPDITVNESSTTQESDGVANSINSEVFTTDKNDISINNKAGEKQPDKRQYTVYLTIGVIIAVAVVFFVSTKKKNGRM